MKMQLKFTVKNRKSGVVGYKMWERIVRFPIQTLQRAQSGVA